MEANNGGIGLLDRFRGQEQHAVDGGSVVCCGVEGLGLTILSVAIAPPWRES